jgi:hypothetical protein
MVHQAQGRRAGFLDEVDLDRRAPGRHAHPAVLPAVGEDQPSRRDQLHEPADDAGAVGVVQRKIPPGAGSAVAAGPTQRIRPSSVVRCAQTTSAGAAIVTS